MNLDLKQYSTMHIGGLAYRILNIRSEADIISAINYADTCQKPLIVIGEGSNSIFSDEDDKFVIAHMQMKGISVKEDTAEYQIIRIAAGESWDHCVAYTVAKGLSGIESLSGIPGTAGAAPIQNIGAYGTEFSDVLVTVSAYDRIHKRFRTLKASECNLGYRDSIFKQNPNTYIITELTIRLSKSIPPIPEYASIKDQFEGQIINSALIRDVVLRTRAEKLPDYKTVPNCGSFFKNPLVTSDQFESIQKSHPNIPSFTTQSGIIKLYAGWLIEHASYKLCETENILFYEKNKLVLTNIGNASYDELLLVLSNIQKSVHELFGIQLEVEPNIFK